MIDIHGVHSNIDYYIVVNEIIPIPSDLNSTSFWTRPEYSTYFMNNTLVQPFNYKWFCLPVGNWELVSEIVFYDSGGGDFELINNDTMIGYYFSSDFMDYNYSELYLKDCGALAYLYSYSNISGIPNVQEITILDYTTSNTLLPILAIGGAIGVVVVAILIVRMRKT